MKISTWLFIALFITTGVSCFAQDSAFLVRAVNDLKLQPRTEKVYLHLNKPSYYPGDTIWYKAYLLTGAEHKLSGLSGVLEVELINSKDSVISRQTLKVTSGLAWSEFILPRKMPGIYHIRAYTNWMRNQGLTSFYFTTIQVGGIIQSIPTKQVAAEPHIDVQFFPEGGELVSGLRSRVAFKAMNTNGTGEDIKGTVEDNDGNVVADIASQHLGMGVFALMPQAGKTYHVTITTPGESSYTVNLPPVRDAGFTLTVNNREKDSIFIKIAANDKLFSGKQNSVFYLVAQSGGRVYYTTEGKLVTPTFVARVARSRFPSGIVQFTLFSQEGEPINERLAFVMNDDTMKMKLTNVAGSYTPRQKVSIGIESHPGEKDSLVGSFSVSVINESRVFVNESAENTLLNNILMTSELKGYIEQPNYYFTNINEQKQADLDVLMLTQGYRRFEWEKVLSNTVEPIVYQPQKALELEGTLKTPSGKPVPYGKVTFAATRDGVVTDTTTDANGNFKFDNLNVSDTAKIVLRARKQHNGSNLSIYVKQLEYPQVQKQADKDILQTSVTDDATMTPEMKKNIAEYGQQQKQDSLENGRQLNEVKITAKKLPKPDIYNNYGAAAEFDADMKKLAQEQVVTAQAFTDVIPGLTYSRERGFFYEQKPLKKLIIDGFVSDKNDAVDFLSVKELESVRVIGITPSTLVVTTKRYAGTDTASTTLKEVTIRTKKIAKPDTYNNYGTTMEYDVNMKKLNREYVTIKDAMKFMVPGMSYLFKGGTGKFYYEHDLRPVKLIVDGFPRAQGDLNTYSPNEIESVRMISPTTFEPPTLIITSKNYAGTDTTSSVNLKEIAIRAKKTPKPGPSNLYGTDHPYTITGQRLAQFGSTVQGLQQTLPLARYSNGVFRTMKKPYPKFHVVINDRPATQSEIDNYRPEDIEDVKVLEGGAYKAMLGLVSTGTGSTGAGNDDDAPIIYITTKQYAGTDTVKTVNLRQVNINAKKVNKGPDLSNSANLNGPGHANQVIMGDQLSNCPDLANCLNGKIFGVVFKNGVPYNTRSEARFNVPKMVIIVDGVLGASLSDLNSDDIYSIEVLRSAVYLTVYGSNAPGGALVITTRRGGEDRSNYVTSTAPAGLITYPFKGYHIARVFYSPKYDHPKTETERFDSRTTIYWNPNIITDKDGKASFEYYNADTKGTYRVVVEGIDEDGKLGRAVYRYQVQ